MNRPSDLKGNELFTSLSMEGVQKINEISEVKQFKAGESIFEPNQEAKNLHILLEGLVALRFPAREHAFSAGLIRIEKDDLIGAGALLGTARYISQAYCVKDSKVLAIDGDKLRDILEEDRITGFDVTVKIARAYFERYILIMKKIQNIFS
jgi:CRP-like cAMP-binding protein